jgi:hypothetical protein
MTPAESGRITSPFVTSRGEAVFKKTKGKEKTKVQDPKADFALKFEMITKDEYDSILRGHLRIIQPLTNEGGWLLYDHSKHPDRTVRLYPQRALDVLHDRLMKN